MMRQACSSQAAVLCSADRRRARVQQSGRLAGIDYVEVYPDRVTLCVHFFGHVPMGLSAQHVVIEGGTRIREINVLHTEFDRHADGDTCLRVTVDRCGDFSSYCLCLVEPQQVSTPCSTDPLPPDSSTPSVPEGIDPRYACASFFFRLDCPSELDCASEPCTVPPAHNEAPAIDYLARDFTSFRRLMLDRMANTMPEWQERHAPDIGITLVELCAYVADQLSYMLDAVATEAYLGTARRRISVRRHARLLDYRMHEGCNARAWVTIACEADVELPLADLVFATPPPDTDIVIPGLVDWNDLQRNDKTTYFEPVDINGTGRIQLRAAHSTIYFYTWGDLDCCLPAGSTRATLLDEAPVEGDERTHQRILALAAGDVLLFEEIRGALTGAVADADPRKRHAVRLTRVTQITDPLDGTSLLEVEWDRQDALPFALCISARTAAPECEWLIVAVAHGNVVLVDHGLTVTESDDSWVVGIETAQGCCECDGMVADIIATPAPLKMTLGRSGITHAVSSADLLQPATELLAQDARSALPQIRLDAAPADPFHSTVVDWNARYEWTAVSDLLSSEATDLHFVAEIDDEGLAQLRFGDDKAGRRPPAGWRFRARYRIGNGRAGNVGHDAIVWMALRSGSLSGAELRPRNPLAARGGTDPEPVADVKLYAPHAYGRVLARAVAAADYAEIAARDVRLNDAYAELAWTGSWYEACVALDRLALAEDDAKLSDDIFARLAQVRRIGHDLRCLPAHQVALAITIEICVANGSLRADVLRAALNALSNRRLPDGSLGFFHPDRLQFGQDVAASAVIAAVQALDGVAHLKMLQFARADADPVEAARNLADGVIAMAPDEIAQLDSDPDFPERGTLKLVIKGGR